MTVENPDRRKPQCPNHPCAATLGVGDGAGNMFVHGSYEAIKSVQKRLHPDIVEVKYRGQVMTNNQYPHWLIVETGSLEDVQGELNHPHWDDHKKRIVKITTEVYKED